MSRHALFVVAKDELENLARHGQVALPEEPDRLGERDIEVRGKDSLVVGVALHRLLEEGHGLVRAAAAEAGESREAQGRDETRAQGDGALEVPKGKLSLAEGEVRAAEEKLPRGGAWREAREEREHGDGPGELAHGMVAPSQVQKRLGVFVARAKETREDRHRVGVAALAAGVERGPELFVIRSFVHVTPSRGECIGRS